jgi:hypothetical protein
MFTRYATTVVVATAIILALSGGAAAYTITGGDQAHRHAVTETLGSQPRLLAAVEHVYPGFSVRICYGGFAWPGSIDVCRKLSGRAFTNQVAHEFCHEIQRACDEPGGYGALGQAWISWLQRRGLSTVDWTHTLEDSMRVAFFAPYCVPPGQTVASKAEIVDLLRSVGVDVK